MKHLVRLEKLDDVQVGKTWTDEEGREWRVMTIDFLTHEISLVPADGGGW